MSFECSVYKRLIPCLYSVQEPNCIFDFRNYFHFTTLFPFNWPPPRLLRHKPAQTRTCPAPLSQVLSQLQPRGSKTELIIISNRRVGVSGGSRSQNFCNPYRILFFSPFSNSKPTVSPCSNREFPPRAYTWKMAKS